MNPLAFIIISMLGRTRAAPEPAPTPVNPEPAPRHGKTATPWTLTLTDATGEERTWTDPDPQITLPPRSGMTVDPTARQITDDPNPRQPGHPWSKTVRTEQQQAAVSAAQAKRDRRAARNLRRQGA